MTQFDGREQSFEKKFEMDEELTFRIAARAAKMLGVWAAEKMGMDAQASEAYVHSTLEADLTTPRHAGLVSKIENDFRARNLDISRKSIAKELEHCLQVARDQMLG